MCGRKSPRRGEHPRLLVDVDGGTLEAGMLRLADERDLAVVGVEVLGDFFELVVDVAGDCVFGEDESVFDALAVHPLHRSEELFVLGVSRELSHTTRSEDDSAIVAVAFAPPRVVLRLNPVDVSGQNFEVGDEFELRADSGTVAVGQSGLSLVSVDLASLLGESGLEFLCGSYFSHNAKKVKRFFVFVSNILGGLKS